MAISSINTNLAALLAQQNIGTATTSTSNAVAALSSGNRLVSASTDVSALATGTALQSQVNILTTSLTVASQGQSLLKVADGALAQIQTILQRQQAIATQAQSGSLSATQLGFLDLEFQNLTAQIDQLAGSTNFNGVKLLNGALSQSLQTSISSNASSAASGSYTVTTNAANTDTLTIGGQAITFASTATAGQVTIGSTIGATVSNLVSFINGAASNTNLSAAQKAAFSQVIASQIGDSGTFTLTARNGGTLGSTFKLGAAAGTLAVATSGQYVDGTQSITGIAVANTSTALTSVSAGGFLHGGTITYGGAVVTGSTISATTTLDSLVANINANTTTTGVRAWITGTASNYTLNLASTNSSATAFSATNSTALDLADTTTIGNTAATIGAYNGGTDTQVITFAGLTSATTALTEGNSGFKGGDLLWYTDTTGPTSQTIASVTLGTTTLTTLAAAINASNGGSAYTATVGGTSGAYTLTVVKASAAAHDGGFGATAAAYSGALQNYDTDGRGTANNTYTIGSAVAQTVAGLTGGKDNGVGVNSTIGTGSILDNIIVGQNQQKSQVTITYPNIAASDLTSTTYFGNSTAPTVTVGGVAFTYTTTSSNSATEIQIGASLQETLDNAVAKINAFSGTGAQNYQFNQIEASRDGNSLVISTRNVGSALDLSGNTVAATASGAGSSVAGDLANGSTSGIDTSGINNEAFVGTISGFTASYTGTSNTVNLSLTVGGVTYAASNVSTNPTSNTKVQLVSTDTSGAGGYLTIQLQALNGNVVNSAEEANNFASRLDTAISGLTFYQSRQVSSYDPSVNGSSIIANGNPIGSLNGSTISFTSNDFTEVNIKSITVTAPQGSSTNGSISFDVDGETYNSAATIGSTLNANTTYKLTNASDPNKYILFTTGSTSINFSSTANANALQDALSKAFGSGGAALTFQVGSTSTDTIGVSIGSAKTSTLFNGASLNVLTQESAVVAASALETAVNTITALRATVGALESRFNFSASAIQNAVQNQGAARSNLLDTDVAATSTAFATAQVQLQAGIAVLAQANQLQQNLLKLIG